MSITINGTTGIAGIDGSAGTPAIQGTDTNTGEFFPAADTIAWTTGGSERMRVDSSGNVGIGTTSPSQKLHVSAGAIQVDNDRDIQWGASEAAIRSTSSNLRFSISSTERMRLDSSGNLLVATTDSSITGAVGMKFDVNGTNPQIAICGSATTNAQITYTLYSTGAAAYRFYVDYGGTIHATSTSITAISDATLKTNIRELETGLSQVLALKPRRFDWINGDDTNVAGFIAQEVEQVLPELVSDSKYSVDENGDDVYKKNLKMGDILPTLVKAIQEQQALITSLTARITALEAR